VSEAAKILLVLHAEMCRHALFLLFLAEAAQKFQGLRSEMQGIATKIGELESDAEEHR
jgi:hypothetical protein